MALAQQLTTPSSFGNNWKGNFPYIPFFPKQKTEDEYSTRSVTIFNKDNQKSSGSGYAPNTSLWVPHVHHQEKLIEMEEYRGFSFAEYGEIAVSYNKDNVSFQHNFKFVCLNKKETNDYYPNSFLIICFELELEGFGKTKDEALDHLYQLFNVYFNRTREIYENSDEYADVVKETIFQQNLWKQSFNRTYNRAQELELINSNYKHQII